tara:strand:+ start:3847 stop:4791 length:945 start_codon:yes stop_codon:yes gene_type:complete
MGTPDRPNFNPNTSFVNIHAHELESPSYEAQLAAELDTLKRALESVRGADVMHHEFNFYSDLWNPSSIYIPDGVHELSEQYGPIESVDVHCQYLQNTGISVEIIISYCDEYDVRTHLRIERPYNYSQQPGAVDQLYKDLPEDEEPITTMHAMTDQQLNRFLASFIHHNPKVSLSTLDTFNWRNADFPTILDNLRAAAHSSISHYEYILTAPEGGPAGFLGYEKTNNIVTELAISHPTIQHIDVSSGGNIGFYERSVEFCVDPNDLTDTLFSQYTTIDDQTTVTYPESDEVDHASLSAFIEQQVEHVQKGKSGSH